jgi:hypothetical protein
MASQSNFADNTQRPNELNPLNPFNNPNGLYDDQQEKSGYQYEETGFNQGNVDSSYQQGGFPARY